jgi:hypothetical protein
VVDLRASIKIKIPMDIGFVDIISEKAIVIIIDISIVKIIYKCGI